MNRRPLEHRWTSSNMQEAPVLWFFPKPLFVLKIKSLLHTRWCSTQDQLEAGRLWAALRLKAQGPHHRKEGVHMFECFSKHTSYLWKAVSCHISDCNFSLVSFAMFQNLRSPFEISICFVPSMRNQISERSRLKGRHGCGTSFNRQNKYVAQ